MKTYAAYLKDETIRLKSSSGGLFYAFTKHFDVIYGVSMTDDCYEAVFVRAENDCSKLFGSKYLQAKVGDAYKNAKKDLDDGKKVMFSGTPCQINGLKLYLQKSYDNLFCIDVICHGVPSPKLWKEYVEWLEKDKGKLTTVNFRSKKENWNNFGIETNNYYNSVNDDPYMRMFLRNYCLRPSCYNCVAKNNKKADITIGDFWGVENFFPNLNDGRGISLVIIRTEKGETCFNDINDDVIYFETDYDDAVKYNPSEYSSVERPKQRDYFFSDLSNKDLNYIISIYASDIKENPIRKMKRNIKKIIKTVLSRGG